MPRKTCFVIIGFGKKTSWATGQARQLDLDQTYKYLIKPVFDSLDIDCYRAIDKNINGSIDELMLNEILKADIALADISTLNANVMWELGVRHALKPHHTIMICEKAQMSAIPFDVHSFIIHQYTHSEEGIPYEEVERFRAHLKEAVTKIINSEPPIDDSPVFQILKDQLLLSKGSVNSDKAISDLSEILTSKADNLKAAIESIPGSETKPKDAENPKKEEDSESFISIMQKAEEAKKKGEFQDAIKLFQQARSMATNNMALKDNLCMITCRLALCTYKSKDPNEVEALHKAKTIMEDLRPLDSSDIEVLGLSGAINKRMFELTQDRICLENAILFYERGFRLKRDYYNGINATFMLYTKAALLKKEGEAEWDDEKLEADSLRNNVLKIALQIESDQLQGQKWEDYLAATKDGNFVWVLYTIAEAYHYKKDVARQTEYEQKAKEIAQKFNDDFATASYQEQAVKIDKILEQL